jgi:hypothetical protein
MRITPAFLEAVADFNPAAAFCFRLGGVRAPPAKPGAAQCAGNL